MLLKSGAYVTTADNCCSYGDKWCDNAELIKTKEVFVWQIYEVSKKIAGRIQRQQNKKLWYLHKIGESRRAVTTTREV